MVFTAPRPCAITSSGAGPPLAGRYSHALIRSAPEWNSTLSRWVIGRSILSRRPLPTVGASVIVDYCLESFERLPGTEGLMAIRVAHVGTGNVGRLALAELVSNPAFEL